MLELYTSMTPLSPLHVVQMTVDSLFLKQNISQDIRQHQSTIRPTRYKQAMLFEMMEKIAFFRAKKTGDTAVFSVIFSLFELSNPLFLFLYD